MNYIRHLTVFFERVAGDDTLNPSHISLYMALFQYWNMNRFQNPVSIARGEIMQVSKVCSKETYHKCMKALHDGGYLRYEPSYNPYKGSKVIMMRLEEGESPQTTDDERQEMQKSMVDSRWSMANRENTSRRTMDDGRRPMQEVDGRWSIDDSQYNESKTKEGEGPPTTDDSPQLIQEDNPGGGLAEQLGWGGGDLTPALSCEERVTEEGASGGKGSSLSETGKATNTCTGTGAEQVVGKNPLNPPGGELAELLAGRGGDLTPALSFEERVTEEGASGGKGNSLSKTGTATNTCTGTGAEQVLVPSINNKNNTIKYLDYESNRSENTGRQNTGDKNSGSNEKRNAETGNPGAKDAQTNVTRDTTYSKSERKKDIPPEISQVIMFFEGEKYPVLEARRFFNHFQSNGWKVGGRAPMKDWQAAARNWMLNFERFNRPVGNKGNIKAGGGKDYGEPL